MATSFPAAGGRSAGSHPKKERLRAVRSATASFSIRSPRAFATWLDSHRGYGPHRYGGDPEQGLQLVAVVGVGREAGRYALARGDALDASVQDVVQVLVLSSHRLRDLGDAGSKPPFAGTFSAALSFLDRGVLQGLDRVLLPAHGLRRLPDGQARGEAQGHDLALEVR